MPKLSRSGGAKEEGTPREDQSTSGIGGDQREIRVEIFEGQGKEEKSYILTLKENATISLLRKELENRNNEDAASFRLFYRKGVEIEVSDETPLRNLCGDENTIKLECASFTENLRFLSGMLSSVASIDIEFEGGVARQFIVGGREGFQLKTVQANKRTNITFPSVKRYKKFPIKVKLVEKTLQDGQRCIVRQFDLERVDKIIINERGDITAMNGNKIEVKTKESAVIQEFRKEPNGYKLHDGPVLPPRHRISNERPAIWEKKDVVQNALKCSLRAYKEDKDNFAHGFLEEPEIILLKLGKKNSTQKCVLVSKGRTMYVSFRGSADEDDWLTNLNIQMVNQKKDKLKSSSTEPGYHKGFLETAKNLIHELVPHVERHVQKKHLEEIVITGHSKGAAISSLVYMLMADPERSVKSIPSITKLYNITFALPMFGNKALKTQLETLTRGDSTLAQNMFHFVKAKDIVPALLFLGHTYKNLSNWVSFFLYVIKTGIVTTGTVTTGTVMKLFGKLFNKKVEVTPGMQSEIDPLLQNCFEALDLQMNNTGPLFQYKNNASYVSIGKYLYLMQDKQCEYNLYQIENDMQFVGQALIASSLPILAGINRAGWSQQSNEDEFQAVKKEIISNHDLEGYERAIMSVFNAEH